LGIMALMGAGKLAPGTVDYYAALLALNPAILFAPGVAGSCFQERTGASATTPSTNGDVVGSLKNQGTLGGWAVASTDAKRPILRVSGGLTYIEFDGVDDELDFSTSGGAVFQNVGAGLLGASHKFRSLPGTGAERIVALGSGAGATRAVLAGGFASDKLAAGGRRLDADSFARVDASASISTSTPVSQIAEFDWTNSDLRQYLNNSLDGSTTSFQTDGSTSNTAGTFFYIGSSFGVSFGDIDLYGLVGMQSFSDRATVHAWLASVAGI